MASAGGREPTASSQRMATSLELGRKKWAKASQRGRTLLTSIINTRSQLDYVSQSSNWGMLSGFTELRDRVEVSLLSSRRAWAVEMEEVLDELSTIVLAMRAAVDDHSARVNKEAARTGGRPADSSTAPLIAHAYTAVGSFERELALRRDLAREIQQPAERLCVTDESARLHMSAWVLEPLASQELIEMVVAAGER